MLFTLLYLNQSNHRICLSVAMRVENRLKELDEIIKTSFGCIQGVDGFFIMSMRIEE